jgi:hypothetical protein
LAAIAGVVVNHWATLAVGVSAAALPCVLVVLRLTGGRRRLVTLGVLFVVALLLLALGFLKLREISPNPTG